MRRVAGSGVSQILPSLRPRPPRLRPVPSPRLDCCRTPRIRGPPAAGASRYSRPSCPGRSSQVAFENRSRHHATVRSVRFSWCLLLVLLGACSRAPDPPADPGLTAEIQRIRAIDNHAHPVRPVLNGPPDREFDALPVDNMEPASDPLNLLQNAPVVLEAMKHFPNKSSLTREKGDSYPAWVLDQIGVDVMLANRVAMGGGIQP